MASISLQGVSKVFGSKTAADRISLDVADREFLVLLGPSGCGKSTLLRMLAGLEPVTSGQIHVGARRVDRLPPGARDMAFVFQSYALYPHMTVRRNIAFPLIMRAHRWWFHLPLLGTLARQRIERSPGVRALVERTANTLALTGMLEQYPRTLSGGQRQRVALGRAMVRQPEVFLMDEPLSNLDAKLRSSMRAEIIKLHREVGGTFVYVTHDQVEAMTMGTRIALLRDGVLQQLATPRAIYADPQNSFVARFIGTPPMNLIEARLSAQGLQLAPRCRLALPQHLAGLAQQGPRDVLLGVRPHAMGLTTGPRPAAGAALTGKVALVEHVGAESIVSVALDEARSAHGEERGAHAAQPGNDVMAVLPGYGDLALGQPLELTPDLRDCVLFARDGQRIRVPGQPPAV